MGHQPENRMQLLSSARTDKGRVRQNNEDSIDLWEAGQFVLAVVADGMGGAVAGEEASRIAIETVRERLTDDYHKAPDDYAKDDEEYLMERLVDVIKTANLNIRERAMKNPELKGMGTTMTLAFARHSDISIVHVGDSRAYQVDGHDGSIHQLTADHSFVQALVDAGHITAEEAENHPMRNVLYRALGQDQNVDVDTYTDLQLGIDDRLVLCSDGLTLHVKPQEIADAVMANPKPADATEKLLALANSRGGKDNISVIVVLLKSTISNDKTTEVNMSALKDDSTISMKSKIYDDVDTVKIKSTSDDDTPPIYNGAYGEGNDTNEPSQ